MIPGGRATARACIIWRETGQAGHLPHPAGTTVQPRAESMGVGSRIPARPSGMTRDSSRRFREATGAAWISCGSCRIAPGRHGPRHGRRREFVVPSPDGRWYAYVSDHRDVRRYTCVRWAAATSSCRCRSTGLRNRSGRATGGIFYRGRHPRARTGGRKASARRRAAVLKRTGLFDVSGYDAAAPHANYDVSPDGAGSSSRARTERPHRRAQNVPELARRMAEAAPGGGAGESAPSASQGSPHT